MLPCHLTAERVSILQPPEGHRSGLTLAAEPSILPRFTSEGHCLVQVDRPCSPLARQRSRS